MDSGFGTVSTYYDPRGGGCQRLRNIMVKGPKKAASSRCWQSCGAKHTSVAKQMSIVGVVWQHYR